MVPHVVRSQDLRPVNLRTIDTGVGQSIELRHIVAEGPGANSAPQVQPVSTNSINPNVASVPGQTASAAAPAAMAQLKAAAQAGGSSPDVPQTNLGVAASATPAATPAATPPGPPGQHVAFLMSPAGPVAVGATFQMPVVISGATDIASVPLQIQYDPANISLVNVDSGDFLSRDGKAVALVHRDDGPGNITINASRPPGSPGINGAGVVCVLSFQAKASGSSAVVISKPGALSSTQQPVPAQGTQVNVSVK
jgi:general secretion pathway protein D